MVIQQSEGTEVGVSSLGGIIRKLQQEIQLKSIAAWLVFDSEDHD